MGRLGRVEGCRNHRTEDKCSRRSDSSAWWLLIRQIPEFDGREAVNRAGSNLKDGNEEAVTTGSQNETNQKSKHILLRCCDVGALPRERCVRTLDQCPSD